MLSTEAQLTAGSMFFIMFAVVVAVFLCALIVVFLYMFCCDCHNTNTATTAPVEDRTFRETLTEQGAVVESGSSGIDLYVAKY